MSAREMQRSKSLERYIAQRKSFMSHAIITGRTRECYVARNRKEKSIYVAQTSACSHKANHLFAHANARSHKINKKDVYKYLEIKADVTRTAFITRTNISRAQLMSRAQRIKSQAPKSQAHIKLSEIIRKVHEL